MKKFFRTVLVTFLVLNMQMINTYCETLTLIEEKLQDVGVSEEYSNNIINYINNLKISDEEASNILNKASDIISSIKERKNYSDFTFSELISIYGEVLNLAEGLNINVDLDLSTKKVVLKDKNSKEILIKCNISDVKKYYDNYKESPLTAKDYDEVKNYISENAITNNEDIKSSNNSNKLDENNILNDSISDLSDENSKLADNSYNNKESSNKALSNVGTVKEKNVNRVLSIIFLILFSCVALSFLVDLLFFKKDAE